MDTAHWKRNLRLVFGLLVVWFAVSFGAGILFVEPLNELKLGGFPVGFWFAQQGSIFVFIVLILVYCVVMDRDEAAREQERVAEDEAILREAGLAGAPDEAP